MRIGRIAPGFGLGSYHGALLLLRLPGAAVEDGAEAADHVTLIAEAGFGCDLGGGPLAIPQKSERALDTLSPNRLVNPLADKLPVCARQPDRVYAQPQRDFAD